MLINLVGGPLKNKRILVREIKFYYWIPVQEKDGSVLWHYYFLDPHQRRITEKKEEPKSKKQKPVATYIWDKLPPKEESNCDVQTFLNAYEKKHGFRPGIKAGLY